MSNPLICQKCGGQMQFIMIGDLYQCEECQWAVSAVEEVHNS